MSKHIDTQTNLSPTRATYSNLPSPDRTVQSLPPLPGPLTIVVLGASGDLAKKKTFPALFGLLKHQLLPPQTRIIGYARSALSPADFEAHITKHIKCQTEEDHQRLAQFKGMTTYHSGQYDQAADFKKLNEAIATVESNSASARQSSRIFYLALPPSVYIPVTQHLREQCYVEHQGFQRIVIEKPFGKDLSSSDLLASHIKELWREEEVYRIDHYLGKEMVKNVMVLRFANTMFGSIWNRRYIDNVQITFKENFGTEGRGGYFDEYGIIRDVMQNHLLQILTIIAMETPASLDAEDIRDEKVKVLKSVQPLTLDNCCVGQYVAANGKPGYTDDPGVPKDSRTPTFATAVMHIRNDRWDGVPFILKCGKALNEQKAEIRIQMRDVPGALFSNISRNELVIRVQPNEAVYMKVMNKQPGLSNAPIISELDLSYKTRYQDMYIPDAYESLMIDILRGDHSNFVRDDELRIAWKILTPLLQALETETPAKYAYGSRGPENADVLIRQKGSFRRHEQEYNWKEKERL